MAPKPRCCAKRFKSGQNTILAVFSLFGQADATMIYRDSLAPVHRPMLMVGGSAGLSRSLSRYSVGLSHTLHVVLNRVATNLGGHKQNGEDPTNHLQYCSKGVCVILAPRRALLAFGVTRLYLRKPLC